VKSEFDQQKIDTTRLLRTSEAKMTNIDAELQEEFKGREKSIFEDTLESLEQERENFRASLELIVITDPTVITRYEERERRVSSGRVSDVKSVAHSAARLKYHEGSLRR